MLTLTKVRLHTGKVKQHITVRFTELAQNINSENAHILA